MRSNFESSTAEGPSVSGEGQLSRTRLTTAGEPLSAALLSDFTMCTIAGEGASSVDSIAGIGGRVSCTPRNDRRKKNELILESSRNLHEMWLRCVLSKKKVFINFTIFIHFTKNTKNFKEYKEVCRTPMILGDDGKEERIQKVSKMSEKKRSQGTFWTRRRRVAPSSSLQPRHGWQRSHAAAAG